MNLNIYINIVVFFFVLPQLIAQTTVQVNQSSDIDCKYSPKELIECVLIKNSCTEVTNITSSVFGNPSDTQTKNYGYFKSNTGGNFPFKEGIVISTGKAFPIGEALHGDLYSTTTSIY